MEGEISGLIRCIIRNIPGDIGMKIRSKYYSSRFSSCGENPRIMESVFIDLPERIALGNNVGINRYCILQGQYGIEIGNGVLIGPYTMLESAGHNFMDRERTIISQGSSGGRIVVGDDVWVGARAVILHGVTLGKGFVVGAGSIVNKDVDPFLIVAGSPAKPIGERKVIDQ